MVISGGVESIVTEWISEKKPLFPARSVAQDFQYHVPSSRDVVKLFEGKSVISIKLILVNNGDVSNCRV